MLGSVCMSMCCLYFRTLDSSAVGSTCGWNLGGVLGSSGYICDHSFLVGGRSRQLINSSLLSCGTLFSVLHSRGS